MMSNHGDFQRQFTTVVEKLLRNVVFETMQLFENSVQELKVEIVRIRKENGNLNDKLNLFEKSRPCTDSGNNYIPIPKDNSHKRDIGVQCVRPTVVERSCSPCPQREDDDRSTFQNLCPSLSEEENRQLALVLVKQEEFDLDDNSTGYFLLKQEDGEAKLIRRQHIKDIPPEVFLSSGLRRKTTEESLSGKATSESTSSGVRVETEKHRISTSEVQTRSNQGVNQGKILQENAKLPAPTSNTKMQALCTSATTRIAAQLPQPRELPKGSIVQSQALIPTPLSMCTQSKVLTQTSQVRIQSAPQPVSKAPTLPSLRSLKSAPPAQVPLLPAQIPGLLPGLLSNQGANITNPPAQSHHSLVGHSVSQGQVQCKPTQVPVSQQQAHPFQFLPQMTPFPNSQPNIVASAGQGLFPAGMSPFQSSMMHLGPPTVTSAPCQVPSNIPSLPLDQNSSTCQMGSNMPLVALLQNSTSAPIPATRSSFPSHQLLTSPPSQSFQSAHETSQVPLSYPLESLYASLDPMYDLEEPTLTTLHPPSMFDQTSMMSEHLSSVSSQQRAPLAQPGIALQTPCMASDQFSSGHSRSISLSGQPHSMSNVNLNRQYRNLPACSSLLSVSGSAHQSDGTSTNIKNDDTKEGQGHSDSVLLRLRSHVKTCQESNRANTRQLESESHSLDVSEESKPKLNLQELSSDGPIYQREEDMAIQNDTTFQNNDSVKDDQEIDQKSLGKSQGRKNQCEVCGRVLSNASALENHARLHTGERPFSCDKCGKAFPSVRGLNRHVQIHADEKQHQCPECGKSFVYHFTLTKHQLIHTGEKPFPCKVCGKRFLAKADRATHMRMHTGEKPYSCAQCGKKFKHRMALNMHMQGHRGEKRYSCPTCGKGFVDLGNFKRHKRIHTGEKPYECKVCGKRFTQSAHLKKHLNTQHVADQ
ncbi:uncharacterized protein LOC134066276 [Sardina pilchardus]|uniref:uncharacterized protein LOC134066276 n=1 Tax=Sardina pilchardus TaxID=27697 RepID=UPI002E163DE1